MTDSPFIFSVSKFEVVFNDGKKLLRFTRSWKIDHPIMGELGDSIDGCLAYRTRDGELKWNPPLLYFRGGNRRKQLHSMSIPFYNGILECLKKSKYISHLDIIDLSDEIVEHTSLSE